MATYPDYDLNTPFSPNRSITKKKWNSLNEEKQTAFLYDMWKNPVVQDTYEPGSTFKLITTAAALEENIVTPNHPGDFYCSGYEPVGNSKIACWNYANPHGSQSLKQALRKFL